MAHDTIDDAEALFGQVIEEHRASHPDREVHFELSDVGRVRGDRVRLGQLLANLVANALEHGPKDEAVRVSVQGSDSMLEIAVANGGAPIPQEVLEKLFLPYSRATSTNATGLGLGLYIVSEIARSHGGTISVQSATGQGTTFRFVLPR